VQACQNPNYLRGFGSFCLKCFSKGVSIVIINQKVSKSEELFFVVDENDNPLKPLPRRLVHGHGVWHRVSHVWVLDGKGNVLCSQRSLIKETNPGKWESLFGGHLRPDESYLQAAMREVKEESGLTLEDLRYWRKYKKLSQNENEDNNIYQGVFTAIWDGNIDQLRFDDGEVKQAKWLALEDVLKKYEQGNSSWVSATYKAEFIKELLASMNK
jgi:isopentenyldiphosphate isomerase